MPAGSFNFLSAYNVTGTHAGLGIPQSTKHNPVVWGTGRAEQGKGGCGAVTLFIIWKDSVEK